MPSNPSEPSQFLIKIESDQEMLPDELDQLTRQLRSELLETPVDSADLVGTQEVPPGAKSAEAISLGTMAVTVLPVFVPKVVEFLQSWVTRNDGKTVKVKTQAGDRSVEVEFSPKSISQVELKTLLETLTSTLGVSEPKE